MLLALAAAALMAAPGDLQVTNIEPGTLLRYPLVTLRGTSPGPDLAAGLTWKTMNRFPVSNGRFVALVELKPGVNMVRLTSGDEILKLRLDYRPMTTPYRVACVYLAAKDEPTNFDAPPGARSDQYGEKLDTVLKLLQSFTAESMNEAGYGRKTFPLEFGSNGMVAVHVIRSPLTGAALRATNDQDLWHGFSELLSAQFRPETTKCCAVMSFTRYDPVSGRALGHCALGGGQLGLFGGASMWSWPTSVADIPSVLSDSTPIDPRRQFDDSGGRGTVWALASTTMGAMLHEMGHTFGLPHSLDPESIMSRGFDHLNRAFCVIEPGCKIHGQPLEFKPEELAHWDAASAKTLDDSPWFQPDQPGTTNCGRPPAWPNEPGVPTRVASAPGPHAFVSVRPSGFGPLGPGQRGADRHQLGTGAMGRVLSWVGGCGDHAGLLDRSGTSNQLRARGGPGSSPPGRDPVRPGPREVGLLLPS